MNVPNIADTIEVTNKHSVFYGDSMRVTGWYKQVSLEDELNSLDKNDFMYDILKPMLENKHNEGKIKLVGCPRKDATHISVYALCGSFFRIQDVKRTGVVKWKQSFIEQQIQSFLNRLDYLGDTWITERTMNNKPVCVYSNICYGYTLPRYAELPCDNGNEKNCKISNCKKLSCFEI